MRIDHPNSPGLVFWGRPNAQRAVAASVVYGLAGSVLVVWLFAVTRPHWIYYLLAAIYVCLCWKGAVSSVSGRSHDSEAVGSAGGVSLSALAFQLALLGVVVGVARVYFSSASLLLLLIALAAASVWVALALMNIIDSGALCDDRLRAFDGGSLVKWLRELTGGLPSKEVDPLGCALSLLLFVAVSWLAIVVWLVVGIAVPLLSVVVFGVPRAFTSAWARRRSPRVLLPGLVVAWALAFGGLTEAATHVVYGLAAE